jgi:hypothetical protein
MLSSLLACGDEYAYVKPTPNFTIETVLEDGSPVSVEVTYELLECEYDFLYPEYVLTDSEGTAGIHIQDGFEYQFYCKSGVYYAYTCVKLKKNDRRIRLILG